MPRLGGNRGRTRRWNRSCYVEPLGGEILIIDRCKCSDLKEAGSHLLADGRNLYQGSWCRGKWTYLYRAVDREGQTLDFMLSERRDTAAARRFFKRVVGTNGVPDRIDIDKSGVNLGSLQRLNVILEFTGAGRIIGIIQSKCLNNVAEQPSQLCSALPAG